MIICKLSWNISALRCFVHINFYEQGIFSLREFRNKNIKIMVLDSVSHLMVDCSCKRGGYLGGSSDLDLDHQGIENVRICERNVEIWKECDEHTSCI